jgi:hypothetical protein
MKDTGQPSRGAGARGKVPQNKPASLPQEQTKKKHPGGRPSKLTPQLAVKIYALAKKNLTNLEIAEILDLTERTIYNWQLSPEFFHAIKEAKSEGNALIERSLYDRAAGYTHPEERLFVIKNKIVSRVVTRQYPPDPASMIFWLKNREPAKWREKIDSIDNLADSVTSVLQAIRKHEEAKARS